MPEPNDTTTKKEQELNEELEQKNQRDKAYFENVGKRVAETNGIHKKYDTKRYTKKAQMSQLIATWREELKGDNEVLQDKTLANLLKDMEDITIRITNVQIRKENTMAKTNVQRNASYYDKIIKEAEQSSHAPNYKKVCAALKGLVQLTNRLNNPQYEMSSKEYEALSNRYKDVQDACKEYLAGKAEFDEFERNREGIIADISSVVDKDIAALLQCDPLNPGSLSEVMEKSRMRTVVLNDKTINNVGAAMSSRTPIKLNNGVKGFFTPKSEYNQDDAWKKEIEKFEGAFSGISEDCKKKLELLKSNEEAQNEFSNYNPPFPVKYEKRNAPEVKTYMYRVAVQLGMGKDEKEVKRLFSKKKGLYDTLVDLSGALSPITRKQGVMERLQMVDEAVKNKTIPTVNQDYWKKHRIVINQTERNYFPYIKEMAGLCKSKYFMNYTGPKDTIKYAQEKNTTGEIMAGKYAKIRDLRKMMDASKAFFSTSEYKLMEKSFKKIERLTDKVKKYPQTKLVPEKMTNELSEAYKEMYEKTERYIALKKVLPYTERGQKRVNVAKGLKKLAEETLDEIGIKFEKENEKRQEDKNIGKNEKENDGPEL